MIKRSFFLIIAFFCFISVNLYSMSFMLGAKSGYYIWKPMFSELKGGGLEDVDKGDGLLYGPVASLMITDGFSLTVSFLTGKQTKDFSEHNSYKSWAGTTENHIGTYNIEIKRTDIDTALSYSLMKNFKLIAGYKYQRVNMDFNATFIKVDSESIGNIKEKMEFPAHGPALGVGYSHAFSDTYFAAVNFSLVYMRGEWKFSSFQQDQFYPDGAGNLTYSYDTQDLGSYKTVQYGMNLEPIAGAMILDNMIVTLGFRFQWVKTDIKDKFAPGGDDITPDEPLNDYIYGMFVSAIYMF